MGGERGVRQEPELHEVNLQAVLRRLRREEEGTSAGRTEGVPGRGHGRRCKRGTGQDRAGPLRGDASEDIGELPADLHGRGWFVLPRLRVPQSHPGLYEPSGGEERGR